MGKENKQRTEEMEEPRKREKKQGNSIPFPRPRWHPERDERSPILLLRPGPNPNAIQNDDPILSCFSAFNKLQTDCNASLSPGAIDTLQRPQRRSIDRVSAVLAIIGRHRTSALPLGLSQKPATRPDGEEQRRTACTLDSASLR